MKDYKSCHNT